MSQVSNHDEHDPRLNKRLKDTPIAIVGMASIFANSRHLTEFWDLISEKINAIIDVPEDRWQADDYFDSNKTTADKVYCQRGGFLPEVDFNPMEFGLPPNILEQTDSSQLLSLVVAKEVLEDANLSDDYDRDRIGITLGIGGGQKISQSMNARLQYPILRNVFKQSGINDADSDMLIQKIQNQYVPWEENSFPGSLGNVIAGRIANRFDLGGMNCVVDAACAGSLAAIRMALTELVEGRSDMMITGGVCTDNSPYMYMSFSKTPAFTDQQNIKPFDSQSNGMMIGEGIGMIAIKRLEDAERDGDKIYAVIKGIGASSDGKFKSIYAPRSEGQSKALHRAYDDAGFAPQTVGLIEAHGTGTAAGDVAEFDGLNNAFSENNEKKQHIALGSIKSQIGHTKSTAGTAGLIKAALALHHKVLPPTINVEQPNPKLSIENSPFYLNTEARPWLQDAEQTPRRAGISSFGFGGTNFHIVLEEYKQEHQRDDKYRQRTVATSLLFSASTVEQLTSELQQVLQSDSPLDELTDKYSFRAIKAKQPRLGMVVSTQEQLKQTLQQSLTQLQKQPDSPWQLPSGASYRPSALVNHKTMVAALFAGQGSQYVNMGKELSCNFPEARNELHKANAVYAQHDQALLSERIYPIPAFDNEAKKAQQAQLTDTAFAQSAIGAISMAQFELLEQAGFTPDMVAGHSFGELSALRAAGVINADDYYQLTFARGQAMAATPADRDAGSMMAVILPTGSADEHQQLQQCIATFDHVKVANDNSTTQQVIAGSTAAITACGDKLKQLGFKAISLPVSGAFHTDLVAHAQQPFAKAIKAIKFDSPQCDLYSNASGTLYEDDADVVQTQFQQHMLQSVRFRDQIHNMYQDGARVFVEFGPKDILQKLVTTNLKDVDEEILTISINPSANGDSDFQYRIAATQLAVAGIELEQIDPYQAPARKQAPTSGMAIKLTGANYVSPATKQKMQQSLTDGNMSQQVEYRDQVIEKIVEVEKIVETTMAQPQMVDSNNTSVDVQVNNQKQNNTLSQPQQTAATDTLSSFFAAQDQVAKLHQQFLNIPQQYGDTFTSLMAQQAKMAAEGLTVPDSLLRSMEMFHQHQSQTLQSHEQFMQLQAQQNQAVLSLLSSEQLGSAQVKLARPQTVPKPIAQPVTQAAMQPAVQVANPVTSNTNDNMNRDEQISQPLFNTESVTQEKTVEKAVAPQASNEQINQVMLEVVADKTGYPTKMLELTMDMEADLGIDSIKRVEILGTVQDQLPQLPELSAEDLAECRTLGEIVSYMNSQLSHTQVTSVQSKDSLTVSSLSTEKVQQTMLEVVAEKTGYPTEMLDLAMDMEADLGIDSIKRVEILGTVQDKLPELPELSAEDLAECRTLAEIVSYMNSQLSNTPVTSVQSKDFLSISSLSAETVQQTMLEVVADKTGYPTEMLELAMDMEADLGIDSIKRVEILGTVQDKLPELPELSAEDLAECRTLGEIVNYMNSQLSNTQTIDAAEINANVAPTVSSLANDSLSTSSLSTGFLSTEKVQKTMLDVVADKTGYPAEMLDLAMDMEADLGIDSIKRVEILGTVQDQLPQLPELNAEDLAECRTLGEIVAYMNSQSVAATPSVDTSSEVLEFEEPKVALPPHNEVTLKKLPAAINFDNAFAENDVIIIADDGQNAGILAEKLSAKGSIVAVVHAPKRVLSQQSPLNSDIKQITLSSISDDAISAAIADISKLGNIAAYVHLQPKIECENTVTLHLNEQAEQHVQLAFLWAKHLQSHLHFADVDAQIHSRKAFITVSHIDGGFGYADHASPSNFELNQAALSGLTKTLAHEWNNTFCRALDIAPEIESTQFAELVLAELFDQDTHIAEVGIQTNLRGQLVASTQACVQYDAATLDASDKILVTGGAKGVTFACALELAKQTQSHFILAGRSQFTAKADLPTWAQGKQVAELKPAAIAELNAQGQKPTPNLVEKTIKPIVNSIEIEQALEQFEAVGASAEYISLDVNDAESVNSTLTTLNAITPITGLIHGAGVLADKYIQDKTLEELQWVYGTKVNGLNNIVTALEPEQLKLMALFSSAAGFYGNEGQSDYAMANEILNKTALQLAAQLTDTKVISFDWGPWDGGMVNSALKKMFTDRGVYVIPLNAGAHLFADKILSSSAAQLLIGSDMQGSTENSNENSNKQDNQVKKPNAEIAQTSNCELVLDPQHLGFIEQHCIKGKPVLPTVCILQWLTTTATEQFGERFSIANYQLLKGVVFDEEVKQLSVKFDAKGNGYHAKVFCDGIPQYQANLRRIKPCSSNIEQMTIETLFKLDPKTFSACELAGDALYQDGSLFHGPDFQGIHQVTHIDKQGLLAEIALPKFDKARLADFELSPYSHPIAADCMLQAMLVWVKFNNDCGSLPVAIEQFDVISALKDGEQAQLQLEVIEHSTRSMTANIALYHLDGHLSCYMKGAKVVINSELNFTPFLEQKQAQEQLQDKVQQRAQQAISIANL
ncbi:MAG: SDR family NAD(P)-dependent oxidoreductase [Parashewanella sp.]